MPSLPPLALPRWLSRLIKRGPGSTAAPDEVPLPWPAQELDDRRRRLSKGLMAPRSLGISEALRTMWSRPAPPGRPSHRSWHDEDHLMGPYLHHAAAITNLDAVNTLLDLGIPVDLLDHKGCTPLGSLVQGLRTKGPGHDPLTEAHRRQHLMPTVNRLLLAGADPNATLPGPLNAPRPLLFDAVLYGPDDLVERLLVAGADPTLEGDRESVLGHLGGNNPGAARFVPLLVAHGARVNARDGNGWTPLHIAVMFHNVRAAQALLDAGADPSVPGPQGQPLRAILDMFAQDHQRTPRETQDFHATLAWWERLELRSTLKNPPGDQGLDEKAVPTEAEAGRRGRPRL